MMFCYHCFVIIMMMMMMMMMMVIFVLLGTSVRCQPLQQCLVWALGGDHDDDDG